MIGKILRAIAAPAGALLLTAAVHGQNRPNIVILFCDDLGYGDLGCYGHPTIRTPNLDRMAAEGIRFTQCYSGSAVCSPSRAALLTGRYPTRNGTVNIYFHRSTNGLNLHEITLPELLKKQGYATTCIGKWHLGHEPAYLPTHRGFDSYYGIPYSNDMNLALDLPFAPDAIYRDGWTKERVAKLSWNGPDKPPHATVPLMRGEQVIEFPADQSTLTQRYTKEALRFIDDNAKRPFFLYLPYTMPHVPLAASKNFLGTSRRGLYGDAVQEVDWSVGRILDRLKERGLSGNTLVIFSSDNGPWLTMKERGGSAGLLYGGKFTTWEGGMRIPAIAWWPGRIAPDVSMELASTMDWFTTSVHLAGGEVPRDRVIDGLDLSALLFHHEKSPRHDVAYYRQEELQAYRYGKWKVHFRIMPAHAGKPGPLLKKPLLFAIEEDPSEQFDVSADHPDIVRDLTERAAPYLKLSKDFPTNHPESVHK